MYDHYTFCHYGFQKQTRAEMLMARKKQLAALAKNRWAK